ncbi:MAG: hypothetical protein Q8L48_00870 [Archangium sp.]|nr:hypothetical protein [Archangium sp.]
MDVPFDGGWAARRANLSVVIAPTTPLDVTSTEFEVSNPGGTVVYSGWEPRSGSGTHTHTTAPLPDAGFYSWRARGVDDAGVVSGWSASAWFQMDGTPPGATSLTATLDGGALLMTATPISDLESGLAAYHFIVSRLDQQDGGVSAPGLLDLTPPLPAASALLGPGTWFCGVHGHDAVSNVGPTAIVGPLIVPVSPTVTPPAFSVTRFDGGTWATYPYLPIDRVRLRVDAGTFTATGFAVIRQARGATAWEPAGWGSSGVFVVTLPAGDQDVRVSMHVGPEVSDWSQPLRVFVDEGLPRTPAVTATRDGGAVLLRWPSTRDDSSTASGVAEYRIGRNGDAGFPSVLHVPDASITFSDVLPFPGAWSYSVTAVDRAGNAGTAARPVVLWPPDAPTGLQVADAVTNAAVQLSWDASGDGGYLLTWDVSRIDALDAGTSVATGLTSPAFVDAAPDGPWAYEVVARVGGVVSAPARLDGVLSDRALPDVTTPVVTRAGSRQGVVTWTASDALSGLASVVLERESDGVAASVGAVTSPFSDAPPVDGTHRYRVKATDLADNVATSGWSAPFVTPGTGVQITRPGPLETQCGRGLEVALTASEEVTWSLVSGPAGVELDADTGALSWTATAGDVGTAELVVSAQAATSGDVITVPVEVSCTRADYALGCGCDSGAGAGVLIAVLLARRRRVLSGPR